MKELVINILLALSPVFLALLGWVAKKIADLIHANVKNAYLKGALVRLDYAVINAVKEVEQTTVEEMRKANADGKITKDEVHRIKAAALASAKSYLGKKGLDELLKVLGIGSEAEVNRVIGNRIESAVHDLKAERLGAAASP